VLDRLVFPLNYQVVFLIGAVGAGLSTFYLGRVQAPSVLPPRVGRALLDDARPGAVPRIGDALRQYLGLRFLTRAGAGRLLRLDLLRGPFGPVMAAYLAFYASQYMSIPLMPVYWVNELRLTDGEISIGNALFYGTLLVASLWLAPLSARLGHRRILILGALFFGLYPVFNAAAWDATLYYLASGVGGVVWALTGAGLVNRLMEHVPENDRPAHMALHNLALNLGILLGSLLGPTLGDWQGLRTALLAAGLLRGLAAVLLAVWA